jgi:hypothetical protein
MPSTRQSATVEIALMLQSKSPYYGLRLRAGPTVRNLCWTPENRTDAVADDAETDSTLAPVI